MHTLLKVVDYYAWRCHGHATNHMMDGQYCTDGHPDNLDDHQLSKRWCKGFLLG